MCDLFLTPSLHTCCAGALFSHLTISAVMSPNVFLWFFMTDQEKSESTSRGEVSFEPTETNSHAGGLSVKRLSDESGH